MSSVIMRRLVVLACRFTLYSAEDGSPVLYNSPTTQWLNPAVYLVLLICFWISSSASEPSLSVSIQWVAACALRKNKVCWCCCHVTPIEASDNQLYTFTVDIMYTVCSEMTCIWFCFVCAMFSSRGSQRDAVPSIHATRLNITALILHRGSSDGPCILYIQIFAPRVSWHPCQSPPWLHKGSRGAKCPPLLTATPPQNPSASLLTSQPRCGAGPVRSSTNRREPVLRATSTPPQPLPPTSAFLRLLPPICACTHIRIHVLMKTCHCLFLTINLA